MFIPCGSSTNVSVECASNDEIEEHLQGIRLILYVVENFVELDEVNPI